MFDISITARSLAHPSVARSLDRCPMPSLNLNRWIQRRSYKRSIGETLACYLPCTCICACVCVYVYDVYVLVLVLDRSDRAFLPQILPSSRALIFFSFFFFISNLGDAQNWRRVPKSSEASRDKKIASQKVFSKA